MMLQRSLLLSLTVALAAAPRAAGAAEARPKAAVSKPSAKAAESAFGQSSRDDEGGQGAEDPDGLPAGRGAPAAAGGGVPREASSSPERFEAPEDPKVPTSISIDIGGILSGLGGYAFPKIPLTGTPDNGFDVHGKGAGIRLHCDFEAMNLDWRVGANGALPGYAGLLGTVGIRKDLSPWRKPRVLARGGGGAELMLAGGQKDSVFLVPVFLGEGELSVEFPVVPDRIQLGAALEMSIRYGLPLGVGYQLGAYWRVQFLL